MDGFKEVFGLAKLHVSSGRAWVNLVLCLPEVGHDPEVLEVRGRRHPARGEQGLVVPCNIRPLLIYMESEIRILVALILLFYF